MSQYPKLSLSMRKDISDSTVDVMDMIGKLDKVSEKLCKQLNKKLKRLNLPETALLLQRTSQLATSKHFVNDNNNYFRFFDNSDTCDTLNATPSEGEIDTIDHEPIVSEVDQKERSKCVFELEEINQLKKVIEIIAAKKVELAIKNYDFIDLNIKTIDAEMTLLETAIKSSGNSIPVESPVETKPESVVGEKRKLGEVETTSIETTSAEAPVNSEPVYCICKRIAFGEMIACDNEDCPVEWFHYPCVNLTRKPKNSWICPLCSNKRKK